MTEDSLLEAVVTQIDMAEVEEHEAEVLVEAEEAVADGGGQTTDEEMEEGLLLFTSPAPLTGDSVRMTAAAGWTALGATAFGT